MVKATVGGGGRGKGGAVDAKGANRHRRQAANFIRHWREFRGLKYQGQLAKLTGVTRATISRLENGSLPYRQYLLEKIAASLNCTPQELIGTNPYEQATIFQIYSKLTDGQKVEAQRMLTELGMSSPGRQRQIKTTSG